MVRNEILDQCSILSYTTFTCQSGSLVLTLALSPGEAVVMMKSAMV